MNILFVTQRFYPHGDATGVVVWNVAEELCREGHNVTVLALAAYKEDCDIKQRGLVKVNNYYSVGIKSIEQVKRELKEHPFQSIYALGIKTFSRIIMNVIPEYRKLSLVPLLKWEYHKAVVEELSKNKYDLCIVTLMPIEGVVSVLKECPKDTKIGLYQLDTYWDNHLFPIRYNNAKLKYESELVNKCSFVLTTPQIYSVNLQIDKKAFQHLIPVEFPMVKEPKMHSSRFDDGRTHCVFIGTLYPKIRPPELVIKILSKIKNEKVVFDFYGSGLELIRKLPEYQEAKDRIILHGSVPSEEAEEIKAKADYLINIDNTVTNQVPSKIFEYIATGKPILNFYFHENSQTIDYLKNYPIYLNVDLSIIATDKIYAIQQFLIQGHDEVPFKTIQQLYRKQTPQYVAQQMINAIDTAKHN